MNTKPYSELYTPELIEENAESFILKLVPKENTTAYSYQIMTINKKRYYPEKIEYFNKKGRKSKVAVYDYIKVSSYWLVDTVTMTSIQENHQTKFIMTNIKINKGLSDSAFTVENMIPK
jgi:outer membrane lipoprotein-sorting protein